VDAIDEKKLLENLRKRKRGALEKAIERYTPYACAVVRNALGGAMTRENAEEAVADAFVNLWRYAENLDAAKGSLRAYLGAAARNAAKNKLRGFSAGAPLEEDFPSAGGEPQDEFERREETDSLWARVCALGEPDAEIFLRYYYYEEKLRVIAKRLALPVSTVKTKLARGRKKLKQQIITERSGGYA
jgi:RNA polymerase sigma-70 factor (ECF subfamily)